MATGSVTLFDEFLKDLGTEAHNLPSDTLKMALLTDSVTPSADQSTPTWSDFSTYEVSGSGYTAGGETLTTVTWTTATGVTRLGCDDIGWVINASGPTNCRWGLLYNTSAGSSEAIGFVDLGGVLSLQSGPIDIETDAGYLFKLTANPA
jgi:hypothetical protein